MRAGGWKELDLVRCLEISDYIKIQLTKAKSLPIQSTYMYVLVPSSYYNKIPRTGWLRNNRNIFLTVLKIGSLRSGCQYGWVRTLFIVSSLLVVSSHGKGGTSFIRTLIPFRRALPSGPNHFPKASSPNTVTLGGD